MNTLSLQTEFEKQVDTLIEKKYPDFIGISPDVFKKRVLILKKYLTNIASYEHNLDEGKLPFVIVVKQSLLDIEKAVSLTYRERKQSLTNMFPHTPAEFLPISDVTIPESDIYLLVNIDRGKETRNIRPNEALQSILKQNHSPLTIDEGIAILTHYPQFLQKNNCFLSLHRG